MSNELVYTPATTVQVLRIADEISTELAGLLVTNLQENAVVVFVDKLPPQLPTLDFLLWRAEVDYFRAQCDTVKRQWENIKNQKPSTGQQFLATGGGHKITAQAMNTEGQPNISEQGLGPGKFSLPIPTIGDIGAIIQAIPPLITSIAEMLKVTTIETSGELPLDTMELYNHVLNKVVSDPEMASANVYGSLDLMLWSILLGTNLTDVMTLQVHKQLQSLRSYIDLMIDMSIDIEFERRVQGNTRAINKLDNHVKVLQDALVKFVNDTVSKKTDGSSLLLSLYREELLLKGIPTRNDPNITIEQNTTDSNTPIPTNAQNDNAEAGRENPSSINFIKLEVTHKVQSVIEQKGLFGSTMFISATIAVSYCMLGESGRPILAGVIKKHYTEKVVPPQDEPNCLCRLLCPCR